MVSASRLVERHGTLEHPISNGNLPKSLPFPMRRVLSIWQLRLSRMSFVENDNNRSARHAS